MIATSGFKNSVSHAVPTWRAVRQIIAPTTLTQRTDSKTLATAGNIHASLIGSTLARMQPILEKHGYQREELVALRDECVQVVSPLDWNGMGWS